MLNNLAKFVIMRKTEEVEMDVSLSNNIIDILKSKVEAGIFSSMDEAITYAITFTFVDNKVRQEYVDNLNAEIEKGWQDYEAGRYIDAEVAYKQLMEKYE